MPPPDGPANLVEALGYRLRDPGPVRRAMQRVAASRPGAWVLSHTLAPVDRVLYALTGGRATVPEMIAGLPVVFVTTTGARSGERRRNPLIGIPVGEGDLAIIGSNYGHDATPGWVHNLDADDSAVVEHQGRAVPVVARRAHRDEAENVITRAAAVYRGYAEYRRRAVHREIAVFVLSMLERSP